MFQAADYYDLSIIKGAISNTVSEWSNPDQVISLCISVALLEPLKLGDNPAIKACISYITKRFLDISLSPLPFEIMKMIVKSEDIVDPEIDIFKALLEGRKITHNQTMNSFQSSFHKFAMVLYLLRI